MASDLGNLGWYSLKTGTTVDYDNLKKNFEKYQLRIMNIKQPSEANLFRKACSSIEVETREGTVRAVKMADSKMYVSRRLVLETEKGKRALGVLSFNKRTKEIKIRKPRNEEYKFEAKVKQYVSDNKGIVDDSHLRQVIRDYFENKLEGLKLRSGLYFIENGNSEKINDLSKALEGIEGCKIFSNKLEDTEQQRDMLKVFIEEQFEQELEEVYYLWKEVMDKDPNKVLAKDILFIKEGLSKLETTVDKAACFTDKKFRTQCLQDLNELKLGVYKYEKSLEEI